MGRIYGDVMTDEGDAGRAFLDFFYRGVIAIDEDDGDIAAVYGRLFFYNNDVAVFQRRKHGITTYLQSKKIPCGGHFWRNFFVV